MADEPELAPYISYFEETYIGVKNISHRRGRGRGGPMIEDVEYIKPLFDITYWNVHMHVLEDEPRTTNALEAWHRRFSHIVGKCHPNVYEFIQRLKEEEAHTNMVLGQLIAGKTPKQQKK